MSDSNRSRYQRRGPGRGPGGPGMAPIEKARNAKQSLGRLVRYFGKETPLVVCAVVFISAGVVFNTLGPRILGDAITRYLEKTVDIASFLREMVKLLAIFLGGFGSQAMAGVFMSLMSNRVIFRMRKEAFTHAQRLSVSYFEKKGIGDMISRLTNDIEMIYHFLSNGFSSSVSGILSLIAITIAMVTLNLPLTGLVFLTFPAVGLIMVVLGKRIRKSAKVNQTRVGALTSSIEETVSGMKVIQSFRREEEEYKKFETVNTSARIAAVDMEEKSYMMMPLMMFMNALSLVFILGIGGYLVVTRPSIYSIGLLTSFIVYSSRFFEPIRQLSNVYTMFQSSLAGAERIFEIFDSREEIVNRENPLKPEKIDGSVEFDRVTFSYEPEKPVVRDISFTATPGHVTAIVGPTGAGKTTLINLLARFYDVQSGSIKIDGRDIREYEVRLLRRNMGIVLQEPFLFAASIRENLLYGNPQASEEQIVSAAELANAHPFISRLPEGYDTLLVERGMNLSQGERQLLAIARTILADPPILILDEATSNIDSFTEIHIQQGLKRLMQGRTSFIVAHRLSTIRNADEVLVIHNHGIIERGTHDELMAAKGFYYRLYSMQFQVAEITEDMTI